MTKDISCLQEEGNSEVKFFIFAIICTKFTAKIIQFRDILKTRAHQACHKDCKINYTLFKPTCCSVYVRITLL